MKAVTAPSYKATIYIAGDYKLAKELCRDWCDKVGACVTVTKTNYTYTAGDEDGVIIGFINYPRFPSNSLKLAAKAKDLALYLLPRLKQESCSVVGDNMTTWFSNREVDNK